jgi:hypothetical protein
MVCLSYMLVLPARGLKLSYNILVSSFVVVVVDF